MFGPDEPVKRDWEQGGTENNICVSVTFREKSMSKRNEGYYVEKAL